MTGGARFEESLLELLCENLKARSIAFEFDKKVFLKSFHGFGNLFLMAKGWLYARADVNIVVARIGLPSIARNMFTKNKTLVVLHNYDANDGKSLILRLYFNLLFKVLKTNPARTAIVCVSPFFERYFKNEFPGLPVFYVPNLFPTNRYGSVHSLKNPKKILLGQYSQKNDDSIFKIARQLTGAGYYCFFCTLDEKMEAQGEDFDVKFLPFEDYLSEMASSYCSLAFPRVNEGWPRMAHESILVGTPVIGYDKGGLGDLLRESDSYIVGSPGEAFELISNNKVRFRTSQDFISKYDISNSVAFIEPLLKFIS